MVRWSSVLIGLSDVYSACTAESVWLTCSIAWMTGGWFPVMKEVILSSVFNVWVLRAARLSRHVV